MKNNSTIHKEKTTFQSESTIIKKGRNDNARHLSTRLPYPLHHTESLDSVLYSKVMTRGPGEVIGVIERKEMLTSCLSLPRHSGAFFLSLFFCHFVQKKPRDLQCLAADEVGPGADLGGDSLAAGQLLAHALSEELGSL